MGRANVSGPAPRPARLRAADNALAKLAGFDLALLAIVLAATGVVAYFVGRAQEWVVMTDELLEVKLGVAVARTLSPIPHVHGVRSSALSQLYPLLTSPFYGLLDMPDAFHAIHVLNGFLLASAAWPVYRLTVEVTRSRGAAYLAAALTVAVPWMVLATTITTVVAAYPAAAWAILLLHRALARPTRTRELLAVAGLALAFLARTQLVLLALVVPLALVAHEAGLALAGRRGWRGAFGASGRAFTERPILGGACALGALGALLLAVAGRLGAVLGSYSGTVSGELLPAGVWHAAAVHLDYVAVAVGVVPLVLASAWAAVALGRRSTKEEHAFAVLLALVVPLGTLQIASFDERFTPGGFVQDRYLFYVVPLLFVGMAAALVARPSWRALAIAGVAVAWLVGIPAYRAGPVIYWASPASALHPQLGDAAGALGLGSAAALRVGTLLAALVLALVVGRASQRVALGAVGGAVLVLCAVETTYLFARPATAATTLPALAPGLRSDWVDAALPAGAVAAVVPAPTIDERIWWDAEFWNESVDRAVSYEGGGTFTPFHADRMSVSFDTGALESSRPLPFLVLTNYDVRFRPRVARTLATVPPLVLVRAARPLRAAWATSSIRADGWTYPGLPAILRIYPRETRREARMVIMTLHSTGGIPAPVHYHLRVGERLLRSAALAPETAREERLRICVEPRAPADIDLNVDETSRIVDGRLVGLHVDRIVVANAGVPCRTP